MINILICLLVSGATAAGLIFFAGIDMLYAAIASLVVFGLLYVLLTRLVMKKVAALMEEAQKDIQAGRSEKAIKTLESGFKYGKQQFYINGQINAQIGTILFLKRDFSAAFDYLQKGFVRHWVAMGMLAICYMKRNKASQMIETFEKATAASKKEALLWNLYAFCLEKIGEKDKAVAVLEKAIKKAGADERLQANLEALKEGKKMKMQAYGDMWTQFHLEKPGALIKKQTKAVQGRRKIVRR